MQTVGHREGARGHLALALVNNTNSPLAHGFNGVFLIWNNRQPEGQNEILTAMRLNPRDPRNAYLATQIAVSYYLEHDYTNCVEAAKRAIVHYPSYPSLYRWLAAAFGQLNWTDKAREALARAVVASPSGFDFFVRGRPAWFSPEQYEHMLEGLRKAGWRG